MEMTRDRAIEFLRRRQPLRADEFLEKAEIETLDLVRRHLKNHPDEEALGLLLGVFGDGDGFGTYQLIEDAVSAHEPRVVVPALKRWLETGPRSVQYWCAQIATGYHDERLVRPLATLLRRDDYDLRYAAVTALEANESPAALEALRTWRPDETDDELIRVIDEVLNNSAA
jgi:HEAT repeat protein